MTGVQTCALPIFGSIDERQKIGQGLLTDIARRNEDIPQTSIVCQTGRVGDVLYIGEGFGIRVSNAWTLVFQTKGNDIVWLEIIMANLMGRGLRDIVVLAIEAAEVAARTGYRQALSARMEMIKRFLLYRVDS